MSNVIACEQEGYNLVLCHCPEGPYIGARKAGTPCCCERCGFITKEHWDALVVAVKKDEAIPPTFPLANRFQPGERVVIPGYSGSYPDASREDRWGFVMDIRREAVTRIEETLMVALDGEPIRGINPDVVAHGDDWRYRDRDPLKVKR